MKSSFLLHIDSLCILDDLNDEQKGQLFYAIYKYQLGEEIELSPIIKIAFSQFKNQFTRDNEAYKKTVEARRKAGSKGGKQRVANQASASTTKQKQAKQAVKDNKKDKDSDSVKDIPNGINANAWNEWVQHRKEIKKTLTKSTKEKQLKFLLNNLENHVAIINQSIQNGWAGLFELKQQQQSKQPMKSFEQQKSEDVSNMVDAVLDSGFNPFDPEHYQNQYQEEMIDVQPTKRIS